MQIYPSAVLDSSRCPEQFLEIALKCTEPHIYSDCCEEGEEEAASSKSELPRSVCRSAVCCWEVRVGLLCARPPDLQTTMTPSAPAAASSDTGDDVSLGPGLSPGAESFYKSARAVEQSMKNLSWGVPRVGPHGGRLHASGCTSLVCKLPVTARRRT